MALEWVVLGYAAGADAIMLLFLTFPSLDGLRRGLVSVVQSALKPMLSVAPFSLFPPLLVCPLFKRRSDLEILSEVKIRKPPPNPDSLPHATTSTDPAPAQPRLCFFSPLLQSTSKSTIGFNPLSLSRCTSPLDTLSSFASNCRRSPAPEMGQGVSCSRSSDEHEFYSAVQSRDLQSVETALLSELGLIHRTTLYDRLSALHIAAANGCIEVPSMLLDRSVQPDAVNRHKQTPLMLAAMHGKTNPPDASSLSSDSPSASPYSSNLIAPIPDPSDASIPAPPLFLTPPNPTAVPTQQPL